MNLHIFVIFQTRWIAKHERTFQSTFYGMKGGNLGLTFAGNFMKRKKSSVDYRVVELLKEKHSEGIIRCNFESY